MDAANAGPEPAAAAAPPGGEREGTVVWAYAIADGGEAVAADLSRLAGVGRAPVRVAACSGLCMLVSDVSRAQFGQAGLRGNLEDLDWLDEVARAHHDVVGAAARLFPLLPARLATVYTGDAAVRATLAGRRTALRDALRRVGGLVEWGVKAYARSESETAPGERGPGEDGPGEDGPGEDDAVAATSGSGLAYLRRRRAQLAAGQQARAAAVDAARSAHAALADRAERVRLHPPQAAQLTGVQLPMLFNAAYLLAAEDGTDFNAAVAAAAAAHPELRIELTGPWPPYSFADDDDDER